MTDKKYMVLQHSEVETLLAILRLQKEIVSNTDFDEIDGLGSGYGLYNSMTALEKKVVEETGIDDANIMSMYGEFYDHD